MTDSSPWKGRLRLGDYYAVWSGLVGDAVSHRHFAAQAVFSDEPVSVIDAKGDRLDGHCLLIEPDTLHRLFPGHSAELWFIEPTIGFGPPDEIKTRLSGRSPTFVAEGRGPTFWRNWLTRGSCKELDARVVRALSSIDRLMPTGVVRLSNAAKESGLSLGRFRHLFAEEVGMPFQRYILWRRMRVAFDSLGSGTSVTDAAHAAGFSDSAHFARTIKTMFGVRASDLLFEP